MPTLKENIPPYCLAGIYAEKLHEANFLFRLFEYMGMKDKADYYWDMEMKYDEKLQQIPDHPLIDDDLPGPSDQDLFERFNIPESMRHFQI